MWEPHKFDALTNWTIPYTKVDIHPKYFDRFYLLKEYLLNLFPDNEIELDGFNISRIEIHSGVIVKCGVWEHDQAAFL